MKPPAFALSALAALGVPAAAAAQDAEIVVRSDAARTEIERILEADNLDTARLGADEVAEAMAAIRQGLAPDDFWSAYRAHLAAWQAFARAEEAEQRGEPGSAAVLARAERAIEDSFDEVERIARRYRARLPVPVWQILSTI
jgi:hypothetical protein